MIAVEDFNPPRDGVTDDAPAIQAAINYADSVNETVVLLDSGLYTLKSQINIPDGVELTGQGSGFDTNTFALSGTVLEVRWGDGTGAEENPAKAAIILGAAASITSLVFDYPLQLPILFAPLVYGPTIKIYKDADGSQVPYHSNVKIEDVIFYKPYVAIDSRGTKARSVGTAFITTHRYQNIIMCALKYGIRIDTVTDWTIFQSVEQQPGMVGHEITIGSSLRDWVQRNGTFLQFSGKMDWMHMDKCFVWTTAIGLELDGVTGPITATNCDFDACLVPVYLRNNCDHLNIKFTACTFTAFNAIEKAIGTNQFSSFVMVAHSGTTAKGITFNGCYLFGPSKGWCWFGNPGDIERVQLINCITDVKDAAGGTFYAIDAGDTADEIIITGNIFKGLLGEITGNPFVAVVNNNIL